MLKISGEPPLLKSEISFFFFVSLTLILSSNERFEIYSQRKTINQNSNVEPIANEIIYDFMIELLGL